MQKKLTPQYPTVISVYPGWPLCNLWFADDINLHGGSEEELTGWMEKSAGGCGIEISSDKSKILGSCIKSRPSTSMRTITRLIANTIITMWLGQHRTVTSIHLEFQYSWVWYNYSRFSAIILSICWQFIPKVLNGFCLWWYIYYHAIWTLVPIGSRITAATIPLSLN